MPILGGVFAIFILFALVVVIAIVQAVRWRRHPEKVLGYFLAGVVWALVVWQITGNAVFTVLFAWVGVGLAFLAKFMVYIFREISGEFREPLPLAKGKLQDVDRMLEEADRLTKEVMIQLEESRKLQEEVNRDRGET